MLGPLLVTTDHKIAKNLICIRILLLFLFFNTSFAYVSKYKNKAEWLTVARSAERVRMGEGVTLSLRWGAGDLPPKKLEKIASTFYILSACWGNQYMLLTLKIYMKKMWLTICTYTNWLFFFLKSLRNLHQNGAFWAHCDVLINLYFYKTKNSYEKSVSVYIGPLRKSFEGHLSPP